MAAHAGALPLPVRERGGVRRRRGSLGLQSPLTRACGATSPQRGEVKKNRANCFDTIITPPYTRPSAKPRAI